MFRNWMKVAVCVSTLALGALYLSCSDHNPYDQRTVMFVSSINENVPYFSDVLNQGDSLRLEDDSDWQRIDDYVEEDLVKVVFVNMPYNGIVDPVNGSLGDFLVTGYDIAFAPYPGYPSPVAPFSGSTSVLVPSGEEVEAFITLVPFTAKNNDPLDLMGYTGLEILSYATITFHGHELRTNRDIDFETQISVNFADPLTVKGDAKK